MNHSFIHHFPSHFLVSSRRIGLIVSKDYVKGIQFEQSVTKALDRTLDIVMLVRMSIIDSATNVHYARRKEHAEASSSAKIRDLPSRR